jgi:hypothetical protein
MASQKSADHRQGSAASRKHRRKSLLHRNHINWSSLFKTMLAGGILGSLCSGLFLNRLPFEQKLPFMSYAGISLAGLAGLIALPILARKRTRHALASQWVSAACVMALGLWPAYESSRYLFHSQNILRLCQEINPTAVDIYDIKETRRGKNIIRDQEQLAFFIGECRQAIYTPKAFPDIPDIGKIDIYQNNQIMSLVYGLSSDGHTMLYHPGGGGIYLPDLMETFSAWDKTFSILLTNSASHSISNVNIQWDGISLDLEQLHSHDFYYFAW